MFNLHDAGIVFILGALVMPQISFSLLKFENVLFTAKLKSSIIL